jgi:protein-tyrosine kinase
MSLIERAVERMTPSVPTEPPIAVPPDAPASVQVGVSMIEKAMSAPPPPTPDASARRDGASATSRAPRTISTAASTERPALETRRVVALDLDSLKARGFVTPDTVHSEIGEEFRVIKRPLVENGLGRGSSVVPRGRRIMVTSAFPGEGKSFCSINLAISIAVERDLQVLLVDADVARPSIPRALGISTGAGLIDRLADASLDVDKLILETNVEKLSILPSGRLHAHATELLASDAMTSLLDELSARYPDTLIIFDSPPLLLTTSSRALARHMGQLVMVVEAGRTPQDAVKDALALVNGLTVVGLILNKSPRSRSGGYYGYKAYGYAPN